MKLFVWYGCESNRFYRAGTIVVMAEDLAQARVSGLAAAGKAVIGYTDMQALQEDMESDDEGIAEDAAQDYNQKILAVKADLAREPDLVSDTNTTVFISGCE